MKNKIPKLLLFVVFLLSTMPVYCGILPYIKEKGRIYFLIGQEAGGNDKYKWSDFSGKPKKRETPKQTAAREAAEETGYVFGGKGFWAGKIKNKPGKYFFVANISQEVRKLGGRGAVLAKLRKKRGGGEIMNYLWITKNQLCNPGKIPKMRNRGSKSKRKYKVKFRDFLFTRRNKLANMAK